MEELVNKLADLQSARTAREKAADKESAATDLMIKLAEENIVALKEERRTLRQVDEIAMGELDVAIEDVSVEIIDAWTTEDETQKTIKGDGWVLTGLLDHIYVDDVAMNYITGFNKTAVKKCMGVLSLPMGAAWIDLKTIVKLEQKE